MKNGRNGVSERIALSTPYPPRAAYQHVGPDVDFPGWNEHQSSPFTQAAYPSNWYHGPWMPDRTQGRRGRVQPRPLGVRGQMPWAIDEANFRGSGCALCDDSSTASKSYAAIAAVLGFGMLAYFWFKN